VHDPYQKYKGCKCGSRCYRRYQTVVAYNNAPTSCGRLEKGQHCVSVQIVFRGSISRVRQSASRFIPPDPATDESGAVESGRVFTPWKSRARLETTPDNRGGPQTTPHTKSSPQNTIDSRHVAYTYRYTHRNFPSTIHVQPSGCTTKATIVSIASTVKAGGGQARGSTFPFMEVAC
jgi:hypothetical protein